MSILKSRTDRKNPSDVPLRTKLARYLLAPAAALAVTALSITGCGSRAVPKTQIDDAGIADGDVTHEDAGKQDELRILPIGLGSLFPLGGEYSGHVWMVQFTDMQTPFAARFLEETEPRIVGDYIDTGKVQFYFRHFLLSFHDKADEAAHASHCAAEQYNSFWDMRSLMLGNQVSWVNLSESEAIDHFVSVFGNQLGLDQKQLRDCIDTKKYALEIQTDQQYGSDRLGIQGIPAFFLVLPKDRTDSEALTRTLQADVTIVKETTHYYLVSVLGAQPYSVFKGIFDSVTY